MKKLTPVHSKLSRLGYWVGAFIGYWVGYCTVGFSLVSRTVAVVAVLVLALLVCKDTWPVSRKVRATDVMMGSVMGRGGEWWWWWCGAGVTVVLWLLWCACACGDVRWLEVRSYSVQYTRASSSPHRSPKLTRLIFYIITHITPYKSYNK